MFYKILWDCRYPAIAVSGHGHVPCYRYDRRLEPEAARSSLGEAIGPP